MSLFEQLPLFRLPPAEADKRIRQLAIGDRIVAYELRQAAGQRLGLSIDERGLRVGAPKSMSLHAIESFVLGHGDWVLKKLAEFSARHGQRYLTIREGSRLPVLGEEIVVRVEVGSNRSRWCDDRLVIAARPDADLDQLGRRALQRRALAHFGERVGHFAAKLGRPIPALALSSARTRWGSCSSKTGIRINWRLIHLPPHFADYVIAHELAHLVHMNHSPRFWRQVGELYPDWQSVRAELKARANEIPII